ncbi:preprotein translocase subunit SecG [Methyloligella halotolerans]|uniref:Preprotein translocase subunit SecG n=1 Tax=Methyloligella halotolerans TaxID=1177755 RepID=A0A1E2S2T9_9HYPH|nr:hypothetical protein [Methyloligella halotolerans]ODA68648.1 preprotein translocase subunit SecG [Methyloligella halotolerans]
MAHEHESGGKAFLAIVLGGIVLALIIAAYFMYGDRGDQAAVDETTTEESAPAPAEEPNAEAPADQGTMNEEPDAGDPMAPEPNAAAPEDETTAPDDSGAMAPQEPEPNAATGQEMEQEAPMPDEPATEDSTGGSGGGSLSP